MKKTYELAPEYTNQKSFYGKATIREYDGFVELYSYGTHMATFNDGELVYLSEEEDNYTRATNVHINEVLQQNGLTKATKRLLIKGSRYLQKRDVIRSFQDVKNWQEFF